MQLVTVGTKYQIVIPKEVRKRNKSIRPGSRVAVRSAKGGIITLEPIRKGWSDENYGAFKKYWEGIDPIIEHGRIAEEWEERIGKLGK